MCLTQECVSICKSPDCSTKPSARPTLSFSVHLENQMQVGSPWPPIESFNSRFPSLSWQGSPAGRGQTA